MMKEWYLTEGDLEIALHGFKNDLKRKMLKGKASLNQAMRWKGETD